jgi:predicted DNA-binding transcriptional regulator AlpA
MTASNGTWAAGAAASVPGPTPNLPTAAADRLAVAPGARPPKSAISTSPLTDSLVSIRDIRALFALGRTSAYDLTHRPDFPAPVRISPRCYRWWASDVNAFAASLRYECATPPRSGSTRQAAQQLTPHPATPPRRIVGKVRVARTRKDAQ